MRCRRCRPVPDELRRTADLLERRFAISVIHASLGGARRFNEFRQAIGGIPPRTLSERLRELERAGLLERRIVPATPPHVEYRLTRSGRELAALVDALSRWRSRPPVTSGRQAAS